jgi:hypothetical protein
MLTEAHHRGEAKRFRRLAETTTDGLIKEKLIKIADLHAKIAHGLQEAPSMSAALDKAST